MKYITIKKGVIVLKLRLIFESDLCWTNSRKVEVQSNVSEEDIKALFKIKLGIDYDEKTCRWEVIDDEVSLDDMLAYTE